MGFCKVNAFNAQLLLATEVFVDIGDFKWEEVESSSILWNIVLCDDNSCVHTLCEVHTILAMSYCAMSVTTMPFKIVMLCSHLKIIVDLTSSNHQHLVHDVRTVRLLVVISREKFSHSFDIQNSFEDFSEQFR